MFLLTKGQGESEPLPHLGAPRIVLGVEEEENEWRACIPCRRAPTEFLHANGEEKLEELVENSGLAEIMRQTAAPTIQMLTRAELDGTMSDEEYLLTIDVLAEIDPC